MAITVFLIRVTPLLLLRKEIKNKFIKSFLYYVPYVTLAVMTFPAIIDATCNQYAGLIALILGVICSYRDMSMFKVTVVCCLTVLIIEMI